MEIRRVPYSVFGVHNKEAWKLIYDNGLKSTLSTFGYLMFCFYSFMGWELAHDEDDTGVWFFRFYDEPDSD